MTKDLINRITYHLSSGGLFNPELADHLAVRNLLMECREALAQRTWVGLTDEAIWLEYQTLWPFHPAEEPRLAKDIAKFARAIEAKLKEKNT